MRTKLFALFLLFLGSFGATAQQTPTTIKYRTWDMHALRYYPFQTTADPIMEKVFALLATLHPPKTEPLNTYTDLFFVIDRPYLNDLLKHFSVRKDYIYKGVVRPYSPWLEYADSLQVGGRDLFLTLLASKGTDPDSISSAGIVDFPGQYTTTRFLNDLIGEMDLFRDRNDLLFTHLSGPLGKKSREDYVFYLSSEKEVGETPCYEVYFVSRNKKESSTEGLLYIDKMKYTVLKAVFTVNYSLDIPFGKTILMEHIFRDNVPVDKKTYLLIGSDTEGGLLVSQHRKEEDETDLPVSEMPAWKKATALSDKSRQTRAWRNVQGTALFLLTDHVGLGARPKLELGALTQSISHNRTEGLRLRLGGRTTTYLNSRLGVGGYVAYGLDDKQLKWRGDLVFSLKPKTDSYHEFPKSLFAFSYVDDLNIPGYDLLTSTRDRFFNSFSRRSLDNMSRLKLGKLSYEQEFENHFSFTLDGKRTEDRPAGKVNYEPYTTTEVGLSLRYAPNEKSIRVRDKQLSLRQGDVMLMLSHRVGLKGVFGSDYRYQMTEASVSKQIPLPQGIGRIDTEVSAGKIWNEVPFPLLFVPRGNQSYIYSENDYNLMDFYEFATDNYLAGRLDLQFNWSPLDLFFRGTHIKTHLGGKILYGPLSDKNNPDLHPGLPAFNNGVSPLGDTPFAKIHLGFSGILKFFRVDYARRLTYIDNPNTLKGSILIGMDFSF